MTLYLTHPTPNTWYEHKPLTMKIEVEESGIKTEYKLTNDEPLYRHVLKTDCISIAQFEDMKIEFGERLSA
jgi:hypothetical protein